ncbi:MAG: hypothetical protein HOE45_04925 [Gammaproteobacteria bacterium]|jgi:hypothetical protein|nr:hypothetical protein [Gammaproteobacteria bacterium]
MALNKTLLYQEIYSDLASDQVKDAASHEPTAGNAIIDQLSRGILAPVMYDSDGNPLVANQSAGSKLGIDQLISSVVDRTIQHILTNLQTSEAEDQILALKDQVTALSNSVLALNSKVIELHTKLVTSHTQSALDASNILTMITA